MPPARPLAASAAVVTVAALAWSVTGLPPFSATATVAVVGSGTLVAIVSRSRRRVRSDDVVSTRSAVIWGSLAVALAAWQVSALVRQPRAEHPTLSSLANAVLDPRPVRTVAFVGWLAGAAWLARR